MIYPNVLLVTIDALRADHVSCLGYDRKTTPYIDELADKGVLFTQAFVNGPTTPFSLPSMIASTYPFRLQGIGLPQKGLKTIAETLRSASYSTGCWSPNPYISKAYNYHRGFQTFMDPQNWSRQSEKMHLKLLKIARRWPRLHHLLRRVNNALTGGALSFAEWDAEAVLSKVTEWLQKGQQAPLFAWCHFNDVHHPWFPRAAYAAKLGTVHVSPRQAKALVNRLSRNPDEVWQNVTPDEMSTVIDLYDTAIRYTDEMIGDFIASNVDLSDTVVIVTADHGEEFGEHGGFHRNKPYDEMLHVPLIMAGHNIAQGKVIDKQVSLINLAPTVADLCGLGKIEEFQGSSLMPVIDGQEPSRVCLSYYNRRLVDGESAPEGEAFIIRWDGWKFVNREGGDELYCLERDPRERFNLIENEPKVAQSLQSRLREEVSRLRQDQIIVNQIDMQELDVIEDRLRALGYIE